MDTINPRTIKILAVDDHRDNLVTLQAVLGDAMPDCSVITAMDGAAALTRARAEDPDVVLLDLIMPGMDGLEVCRRMKAEPALRAVPIIILTALGTDRARRVAALEAGADAFLAKPPDEQELVAQIRAMVRLKVASRSSEARRQELERLVVERTRALEEELAAHRRAQVALRDSEALLREAQVVAGMGSYVFHIPSGHWRCSDLLERLFGIDSAYERSVASWEQLVHPDDRAAMIAYVRNEVLGQRRPFQREYRIVRHSDGVERWVHGLGELELDASGAPVRMRGIIQDITDRKRSQLEREQLQASLAQSDRLANMGMLAAGVAHEINNPLAYVLYSLETLVEDAPSVAAAIEGCRATLEAELGADKLAGLLGERCAALTPAALSDVIERLRDALGGTRRIQQIARSLGTFSRVESTELTRVSLGTTIEHAATMAQNEIKYRARLVKDFADVPPVLASDGKLAQVFLNLFINAAHAIAEGRVEDNEIRVRTFVEQGRVCAEVIDTGKGIAPEHQPRVFEPFFTTKGVGVGSGLGLPICKSIVTSLGGEITFTSEVGKGTRFRLALPVAPPLAPAATETPRTSPPPSSVRGRLLIVDDEAGVRGAMARVLGIDHEVVAAASGLEAKRLLTSDRAFDVVFCDLMMQQLSGMELHAWLAEADPALARRVVFVTGGAFTPGAARYLAGVANLRLEKPFDSGALRQLATELVEGRAAHG